MLENYLESLRLSGKSELTIRQHRSSLSRFRKWLDSGGGYTGGAGVVGCRRNSPKTDVRFLKNSDTINNQNSSQSHASSLNDQTGINAATQLDIANFKRWASKHYKPRTVSLNMIHLNAYYRYLVAQGIVPDNPCTNVDPVTVQQEAPKWLDRNEQNALIRAVRKLGDLRELTIITVLLHTGLRVQELCDIRLKDVIIGDRKGTLIVQSGKGGKYREVPLNVDARRAIDDYLVNGRKDGSEYLFTTQRSDKMTSRAVQHILEKYAKFTGLQVSPHVLRHTFCHELAVRKVPFDVIARLAGHMKKDGTPNLAMVTRYTLPNEDDLARAVEELSWR